MSVFFDTNVLVYAVDRSHASKRTIALAILEEHVRAGSLVVSTQVLQEFYAVVIRRALLAPQDALSMVCLLAQEKVVASNADFVTRALSLSQRDGLSSWDALIVQAALDAGCSALLSEDLQAGRRFGDLEVVDPFAHGVQEPRRRRPRDAPRRA